MPALRLLALARLSLTSLVMGLRLCLPAPPFTKLARAT